MLITCSFEFQVESTLSHGCSVAAAMDSDSTDVVVNPLSVLPVSSASSLNSGWSGLLSGQSTTIQHMTSSNGPLVSSTSISHSVAASLSNNNVPSPMPASPAPQGSPINFPQRIIKSVNSTTSGNSNQQNNSSVNGDLSGGFPKPAYSYSCLIALALKNSRTGCLPVSEIYRFMW